MTLLLRLSIPLIPSFVADIIRLGCTGCEPYYSCDSAVLPVERLATLLPVYKHSSPYHHKANKGLLEVAFPTDNHISVSPLSKTTKLFSNYLVYETPLSVTTPGHCKLNGLVLSHPVAAFLN